jgi:hypothetical protein
MKESIFKKETMIDEVVQMINYPEKHLHEEHS